jgi:hypothetical protein
MTLLQRGQIHGHTVSVRTLNYKKKLKLKHTDGHTVSMYRYKRQNTAG